MKNQWTATMASMCFTSGENMILICWYPKYRQEENNWEGDGTFDCLTKTNLLLLQSRYIQHYDMRFSLSKILNGTIVHLNLWMRKRELMKKFTLFLFKQLHNILRCRGLVWKRWYLQLITEPNLRTTAMKRHYSCPWYFEQYRIKSSIIPADCNTVIPGKDWLFTWDITEFASF